MNVWKECAKEGSIAWTIPVIWTIEWRITTTMAIELIKQAKVSHAMRYRCLPVSHSPIEAKVIDGELFFVIEFPIPDPEENREQPVSARAEETSP